MTCQIAGLTVPVGGGGYLRLFPWAVTSRLLRQIRQAGRPLNVYLHPWEVDVDQPRIAASLKSRFRHYQNMRTMAPKLSKLLTEFRLGTMTDVLDSYRGGPNEQKAHSQERSEDFRRLEATSRNHLPRDVARDLIEHSSENAFEK